MENVPPQEDIMDVNLSKGVEGEAVSSDGKGLLFIVLGIIGIFVLLIAGFNAYNYFTTAAVVSVDELHQENLAGDLDEDEGYTYNGYSFVKADGLWWTEMNKFGTLLKIPLHFGPKELEDIPITGTLDSAFNDGDKVYIAIDPNVQNKYYTLAISELSFNTVKGMDRLPIGSCTKENWACDNRTIISCDNTHGKPVIELALANETKIELNGTCIKVSGREYGIVKSVDRILYQWYGVME
ncbi:MAG: hypothetical protein Q7K45_06135 [Nanoarchaeota archaeon]|nr:hypothetical protein [Nanoarchaeota archaeon]